MDGVQLRGREVAVGTDQEGDVPAGRPRQPCRVEPAGPRRADASRAANVQQPHVAAYDVDEAETEAVVELVALVHERDRLAVGHQAGKRSPSSTSVASVRRLWPSAATIEAGESPSPAPSCDRTRFACRRDQAGQAYRAGTRQSRLPAAVRTSIHPLKCPFVAAATASSRPVRRPGWTAFVFRRTRKAAAAGAVGVDHPDIGLQMAHGVRDQCRTPRRGHGRPERESEYRDEQTADHEERSRHAATLGVHG